MIDRKYNTYVNEICDRIGMVPMTICFDEFDNVKAQVSDCLDKGWEMVAPITLETFQRMLFGRESKHVSRGFFMNKSCVFYAYGFTYVYALCNYDNTQFIVRKRIDELEIDESFFMDSYI